MNTVLVKQHYADLADDDLFALVRKRDEQAFEALYGRYKRTIFAFCVSMLKHNTAAEDAFQFTFSTMFEKRDTYGGGNFKAWLFTIARHHCYRVIKNQQRTTALESTDEIVSGAAHMDDDVFMTEALNNAIAALPDDMRQALELRYFGELSYAEIAEQLDVNLSAAKVRVFRAKKMLQKTLSPLLRERP